MKTVIFFFYFLLFSFFANAQVADTLGQFIQIGNQRLELQQNQEAIIKYLLSNYVKEKSAVDSLLNKKALHYTKATRLIEEREKANELIFLMFDYFQNIQQLAIIRKEIEKIQKK